MSPTSRELVANKPLSGLELAEIIKRDVEALIKNDCMLTGVAAFGRVSYEVKLTLHFDNFSYPTHTTSLVSRTPAKDKVIERPELAAISPSLPLPDPSPSSIVSSVETHRDITSPNVSRIENALPIDIITRDAAGMTQEKSVRYPESMLNDHGPEPVTTDLSDQTRKAFNIPELKPCACVEARAVDSLGLCSICGGLVEA